MAGSIDTGGKHGGKRALAPDLPLTPFIDLMFCIVAFLLATAVWNEISRVETHLPGNGADALALGPHKAMLFVHVSDAVYVVATSSGIRDELPRTRGPADRDELSTRLRALHDLDASLDQVTIDADDGVSYADLVDAMDTAAGAGYANITMGDVSM